MKVVTELVTPKMVVICRHKVMEDLLLVLEDLFLVLMEKVKEMVEIYTCKVMEDLLLVLMEKVREMVVLSMEMVEIYKRKEMEELRMGDLMENLMVVICRCREMEEPPEKMMVVLGMH